MSPNAGRALSPGNYLNQFNARRPQQRESKKQPRSDGESGGAKNERDNLPSAYAVYLALTVLASDGQSETFTAKKALIAYRAGASIKTAERVLKRMEAVFLIRVDRQLSSSGRPDGASTYTLLGMTAGRSPVRSNGAPLRHEVAPVRHQGKRGSKSDKVEETERNSEETLSSPSAPRERGFESSDLETIYRSFPRREGKQPAINAIRSALVTIQKRGELKPVAWLLERVKAYTDHCNQEGKKKQHIKMPQGWFNDGRYDDDLSQPAAPVNGINGHAPSKPKPIGSMSAQIAAHQPAS